jgi:hypothetical protein
VRAPFSTALAIAFGLVVLLGYFIPAPCDPANPGLSCTFLGIRVVFLDWGAILAGVAMLVGIVNLALVHWRKVRMAGKERDLLSAVFLLAFLITLAAGFWFTPADVRFQRAVLSIQTPVEISLMALLVVTLAYASLRLLQRRSGLMAASFVISALVFLLLMSGLLGLFQQVPLLRELVNLINRLPLAGARGILLGIALGSLTAGLRILLGADRPYSG